MPKRERAMNSDNELKTSKAEISLPREVENYDDYEKQRLIVTPGLTCFWQVYPKRHEISFDDWVALDVKYVVERSWKLDVKLIFMTVLRVLKGHAD